MMMMMMMMIGLKYDNQKKKTQKKTKHNEKAEWINNMVRELEGLLEEVPKVEIDIDLPKTKLKKISNWKTSGYDGSGSRNSPP